MFSPLTNTSEHCKGPSGTWASNQTGEPGVLTENLAEHRDVPLAGISISPSTPLSRASSREDHMAVSCGERTKEKTSPENGGVPRPHLPEKSYPAHGAYYLNAGSRSTDGHTHSGMYLAMWVWLFYRDYTKTTDNAQRSTRQ